WYEAAVGSESAPYLAAYYDLWEDIWMDRAVETQWFQNSKNNTYLSREDVSYLNMVTEHDIVESRTLLETALAKAETNEQLIRAEQILRQFEFYEASVLSYTAEEVDRPKSEEEALELLRNVKRNLERRVQFKQKQHDLIEEFNDNLA